MVKGSHRGPLFDISDNLVTGMLPAPGGRGAAPIVRELVPPPQDFAGRGWEVFSPALSPGDAVIVQQASAGWFVLCHFKETSLWRVIETQKVKSIVG